MVERLHRRLKESLIALGQGERHEWFWKLPMSLLALRTTVKPDLGASPSELVFGEGVTVPGQLVGPPQLSEEELLREQRSTLSNLHVHVERLQPRSTSAHRRPQVHIPEDLATATHVLVRKGIQPSLTAPYEGPFKVLSRTPTGYRLHFPGRGSDVIAISRLKPAFISHDERDEDEEEVVPPSPPPPGRRPGPRTRQPAPTSRQTRSSTQQQQQQQQQQPSQQPQPQPQPAPTTANEPNNNNSSHDSQQPCSSRDVPGDPLPNSPPPPLPPRRNRRQRQPSPVAADPTGRVEWPDDPNLASCPDPVTEQTLSNAFPHLPDSLSRDPRDLDQPLVPDPPPAPPQNNGQGQGGARRRVLSFSRPKKGNFSYQRPKPDVNFLQNILSEL